MTPHTSRKALIAWFAALLASLWLAGCGPGVGGTGTDSVADALAQFGAQAAAPCPVCTAPAGAGADAGGATATPKLYQTVSGTPSPALVAYVDRSVALDERCTRWRFIGEWGSTPAGNSRYYGLYLEPGQTRGEVAALSVTVLADGRQTLTLRDLFDRVLLGPLTVEPVTAASLTVSCP